MKYLGKLLATLFIVLGASCSDPYAGDTFVMYDTQPASSYLSSRSDDFSEWITVMKYADLYNAVNQATQYFTLFAPTNEAMQEFYTKKGVSSITELGEEYAINLVKYHLIQDTIDQNTFISQEGSMEQATVSGDYLSVNIKEGEGEAGGLNSIYLNNEAHVIEFANRVSNGYVYVLENTLTPLTESVYERFEENASIYSIFKAALDATGLGARIDVIYEDVVDEYGLTSQIKRNYTVLAVTDEVFSQEGINSLSDLVSILGAGSDYTSETNALYQYMAYHIISGSYDLSKLKKFDTSDASSKLWNTLAAETVLRISDYEDTYYLNYNDANSRTTFLEDNCDLQAKNGYIHQLAGYMPVAEPDPETVLFDVTNFEEIESWLSTHGSVSGVMVWQTASATEDNLKLEEMTNCPYEFKLNNPGGFAQKITYFTAKSSSAWKNASYSDYLMLNLGYNGWISIPTPTLIKGKYKVTMQFGYATSMNFIRTSASGSNGGEMRITIDDGNEVSVKPYTSISSNTLGNYQYVIYEEIEFDATASHTFKLVMNDPVASTSSSYRIMIDYLLFEPLGIIE